MNVPLLDDALRDMSAQIAAQLGKTGFKGADLPAAATTSLSMATGWYVNITGTASISSFGSGVTAGQLFILRFTGAPTLVHHATNLILPGGTSIPVAANNVALMMSLGSGAWRCIDYSYAASSTTLSGTYTPTVAVGTNVSAVSPGTAFYQRIGPIVTVSGTAAPDPIAASTLSIFYLSLPVASNLGMNGDLVGTGTVLNVGVGGANPVFIYADSANNRAALQFTNSGTLAAQLQYTYTYRII